MAGLAEKAAHPAVVRTVDALRRRVGEWHARGERVGLVPTMGALHEAHLSLIRRLAPEVDRIVVSIFVNPTQFGPGEDFEAYPRREADDLETLAPTAAELVFAPTTDEMYPQGFATTIRVAGLTEALEGAHRPGHFDGVATVVLKLFQQSRCDAAVFGEKDYQQLAMIRKMVRDLDLPVTILSAPVVREADGLALSSRNAYLDPGQRQVAPALHRTLCVVKARAEAGEALETLERQATASLLDAGFEAVDYCSFRDAATLAPVDRLAGAVRLLAAARLGATRLLDNLAVDGPPSR